MKKALKLKQNLKSNYIKVLKQFKKRIVKHTRPDKVKEHPLDEDLPLTIVHETGRHTLH